VTVTEMHFSQLTVAVAVDNATNSANRTRAEQRGCSHYVYRSVSALFVSKPSAIQNTGTTNPSHYLTLKTSHFAFKITF
jgi:hypothetical protein